VTVNVQIDHDSSAMLVLTFVDPDYLVTQRKIRSGHVNEFRGGTKTKRK
jgi:hypothetical protein